MSSKKINLNGKPVGRTKAGWLLFKETWRYFKADTELIFIPLITTGINLLLLAIASAIAFVASINSGYTLPSEDGSLGIVEYAFIFVVYVIAAFCLALSEAGITNLCCFGRSSPALWGCCSALLPNDPSYSVVSLSQYLEWRGQSLHTLLCRLW
ncbi:MAG: hypothetical protein ACOC4E_01175 [Patescibacteria group bacterium]